MPTRDRPASLERCLTALSRQTAAERLEIIVVDDGSAARADVEAVVGRCAGARLVRLEGCGPAAARNAGARRARGDILCFTDDDCVPEEHWAETLAAAAGSADVVGGATVGTGRPLAEAAELIAQAPAWTSRFAPTNNLACLHSVLEAEPFDETFPDAAGEDREWCARIIRAGFTMVLEPSARVVHRQELTLTRFLRRQVRYGRGAYRFRAVGEDVVRLERPRFYLDLVSRGFSRGVGVGALVALAQVATAVGFAGGWISMRRDGRRWPLEAQSPP